ncbi:mpv17-like protein 2 [Sycon ciliatum]|uniref:mpv17-like protein 2 n=1 Tax=Sycon ciliatum TaxID=27933 RepID=UPI0020AADF6A|eukprot:scpid78577/ scgid16967/ Mpv17-like protein 2
MLKRLWERMFSARYLVVTNSTTTTGLFGFGDILQQKVIEKRESIDWPRAGRMAAMGLLIGPLNHYWYVFLDRRWPGKTHRLVLTKVLLDEIAYAPVGTTVFYIGMGTLEKRSLSSSVAELREKFLPTYMADWQFWPAVQLINFYFVPTPYRVLVVNLATLCWNVFLSYMKHTPRGEATSKEHGVGTSVDT